MTLEHATHTTYKITRFDSEEWLNYNKKERSKPLKNEPNCLKPGRPGSCHSSWPRRFFRRLQVIKTAWTGYNRENNSWRAHVFSDTERSLR